MERIINCRLPTSCFGTCVIQVLLALFWRHFPFQLYHSYLVCLQGNLFAFIIYLFICLPTCAVLPAPFYHQWTFSFSATFLWCSLLPKKCCIKEMLAFTTKEMLRCWCFAAVVVGCLVGYEPVYKTQQRDYLHMQGAGAAALAP